VSRRVRLILCSGNGTVLESLPRFTVDPPWWPDAERVP
jgi:hypothetical protein